MPESLNDGWMAFLLGGLLLLATVVSLRPRRRVKVVATSPRGVGAALAFALDGEFERSRAMLEARVRASRGADADAVLGLLAVLRAEGQLTRAAALVQGLLRRQPAAWLMAAGVRICLDAGQPNRAAALARNAPIPLDLRVAALVRAGLFEEAEAALASRVGRKDATAAQLGSVLAIRALQLLRTGDEKGARRRFKRAVALVPEAVAVLVAGEKLHTKPPERARAAARLAERTGRTSTDQAGIEESGVLGPARLAFAEGRIEEALGRLRDRLDVAPDDEGVRRQYEIWLLAHGEAADWRAALAERAELGRGRAPEVVMLSCDHCGLALAEPVFLCPRCDHFDTMQRATTSPVRAGVRPSAAGARLVDLAPDGPVRGAS